MSDTGFRYRIDGQNMIVSVGEDWDDRTHALEAAAPESKDVLGTCILEHVTGSENRQIFSLLFAQCRKTRQTLFVQFRCDGPELRRWMELEIRPLADRRIEVISRLVSSATRPYVALLDCLVKRSDNMVTICSWCKRVQVGAVWEEVEDAVNLLGLFKNEAQPSLQQGMCEQCEQAVMASIRQAAPADAPPPA